MVGAFVFVFGLALQYVLVRWCGIGHTVSYVIQGVLSVQTSFLLNHYWTWRDRNAPFLRAFWRFNVQKAVAQVLNLGLYVLMVRLGMEYLVANVVTTIVFTFINYFFGDNWVFTNPLRLEGAAREGVEA